MSYMPFCSVEVEFSNMQGLHDLINNCDESKHTLVVCDAFTTDIWGITEDIRRGMKSGHLAWVNKCPGNPTQQDVLDALKLVGELKPEQILAIGGGSTIDLSKAISAFYYLYYGRTVSLEEITQALRDKAYNTPHRRGNKKR